MAFDFSFDPGTSEVLQREVDKITSAYQDQERTLDRTIQRTRQLDGEIKRVGQTMRQEFGRFSPRGDFGNIKDVLDLGRGQITFRNVVGAMELATDAARNAGFARLAGAGAAVLGAVPFIGAGVIAAKTIKEIGDGLQDVKEAKDAQHKLKSEAAQLFRDMPVEDQKDIARRLDKAFGPKVGDEGFWDVEASAVISGKRGAQFAQATSIAMQNPELASALVTQFRTRGWIAGETFKGNHQALRALQGELVGQSAHQVRSFMIAESERDPEAALKLAGYVEKELKAFATRNTENENYLKNHPVERAEHSRRMLLFNAYEKQQLLETQDWNTH